MPRKNRKRIAISGIPRLNRKRRGPRWAYNTGNNMNTYNKTVQEKLYELRKLILAKKIQVKEDNPEHILAPESSSDNEDYSQRPQIFIPETTDDSSSGDSVISNTTDEEYEIYWPNWCRQYRKKSGGDRDSGVSFADSSDGVCAKPSLQQQHHHHGFSQENV